MTQRIFTDAYIRGLKRKDAPYKRAEYAPKGEGRLTVRVLPTGVKEFFYRYRASGSDRTIALGRYDPDGKDGRTLAQIRDVAKGYRRLQADTGDVKEHLRLEKRRKAEAAKKGSLKQLLNAYVDSLTAAGKMSANQVKGMFERNVIKPFPALADAKANEIDAGDVQKILARMVQKGITTQVNRQRSWLSAAFAYGAKADHDPRTKAKEGVMFGLKGNPVAFVRRIEEYERAGDRTLSEDELRSYWNALEALPPIQRSFLRFNLALGGQRITQLLRVSWADFNFDTRELLLRDAKGRLRAGKARDHLLPLTEFALEQLKPVRDLNEPKEGQDPATISPPFSADGSRSMVLETLSASVRDVSATLTEQKKIPAFQLRDLRRTSETMLAEMGIDRETRAHVLSHGRTQGVQEKHYDRYTYMAEKRAALERWAERLQRILDPERKATVIELKGKSRRKQRPAEAAAH